LAVDRREQLRVHGVAADTRLRLIRIERRLQGGVLRQRTRLCDQLALPAHLESGEHPLARLEARRHRLAHLTADADGDHDEDDHEQHEHGGERHRERFGDETRRTARGDRRAHYGLSTGSDSSTVAALPRSTRTEARRSPTRSCHATTVYSP